MLTAPRILITGGTGFLGSLVLRSLRKRAVMDGTFETVTALSRNPDRFRADRPELQWPGLTFIRGDIESLRFEPGARFDYVFHGANPSDPPATESEVKAFRKTVIGGTSHLLTQLENLATPPRRILLLSSGAVYGPVSTPSAPFAEDFPTSPATPYGRAKLETEGMMIDFARRTGVELAIARVFACAGRYLPLAGRFALGQFIRSARERGEIRIRSDGRPLRSYLAGDELAEWLLALLMARSSAPEVFNVGSDHAITIREMAETVRDAFSARGRAVSIVFDPPPPGDAPALALDYIPSIRQIADRYGLKPRKSSIQAIRETTEWVLDET